MEENHKEITYEQAYTRLQQLVEEIEQGDISIDQLAEKVKEAKKLFEICINKLTSIEDDISNILKKMPDTVNKNTQNH